MTVGEPANVTITANSYAEGSSNNIAVGATVTLAYTGLNSAYNFTSWDVYRTGASSTKVTVTSNSFTMPAYPVTVTAVLTEKPQYTVTYSVDGSTSAIAAVTVHQGESVTLPASGATGLAASVTDGVPSR